MIESIAAVVTAVGVVVAGIGVGFAGIQLRAGQLQRYRQFESLYVQRYWALLDRLSPETLRGGVAYEHLDYEERKAIAMYVRLCEDQLEMRKAGAITTWTYGQWRSGMVAAARQPTIAAAIDAVSSYPSSPCVELKRLVAGDGAYDPLHLGRVRRWLRGLS